MKGLSVLGKIESGIEGREELKFDYAYLLLVGCWFGRKFDKCMCVKFVVVLASKINSSLRLKTQKCTLHDQESPSTNHPWFMPIG